MFALWALRVHCVLHGLFAFLSWCPIVVRLIAIIVMVLAVLHFLLAVLVIMAVPFCVLMFLYIYFCCSGALSYCLIYEP